MGKTGYEQVVVGETTTVEAAGQPRALAPASLLIHQSGRGP